ncbi:hypothetical protein B6U99_05415 [Candidatus Geothermarchaeota archaeon ex4572_27]|nr:MAG: hypothetical protein B6U99_05415 [Candidatus Geothermarchaeota archaeon ex4572_27]
MKVHFATVGRRLEPILVGIRSIGADRLVLFATRGVENESWPVALELADRLKAIMVEVRPIVEIELFDLVEDVKRMVATIREVRRELSERPHEMYFNVSGGTKVMSMAGLIASYMEGLKPYYVVERPTEPFEAPLIMLPALPRGLDSLTRHQKEVLIALKDGPKNLKEIAEKVGIAIPSVKHNVDKLTALGLIEPSEGRGRKVRLTDVGRLWLWLIELERQSHY